MSDSIVNSFGWQSKDSIELVTLILAVPGTAVALLTLWIVLSRRRNNQRKFRLHISMYDI